LEVPITCVLFDVVIAKRTHVLKKGAATICPRGGRPARRCAGGDHQASKRGVIGEGEHGRGDTCPEKALLGEKS